jgi:glycosyltransferase involved in cell wall biosynthesis
MKISIVIPFLNEEQNIERLVSELSSFCTINNALDFEVVFVDDGSSDNSVDKLKSLEHVGYQSVLISFSKNYGSHLALRAGIEKSTGDFVTFMYADLQDPIDLIIKMYEKINIEKLDIVWATRENVSSKFLEKSFSNFYSKLMKSFVSKDYPDKGFDIVMFTKQIKTILDKNQEANSSLFLHILTLGFNQGTIFYNKLARENGQSKWTFSKKIKLFIDSFISFSYAPIRFVTIIGISLFILGFTFILFILFRKFVYNDLVSGWPMLVSILCIGFGITNISLGIIAEYLWRTLDVSRNRTIYNIKQIENLN